MGFDVVNDCGGGELAALFMHDAQWMPCQVRGSRFAPSPAVEARAGAWRCSTALSVHQAAELLALRLLA